MAKLLRYDHQERLTAREAMCHAWFDAVEGRDLVARGVDASGRNGRDGGTALHELCASTPLTEGHVECCRALLRGGADPALANDAGKAPLNLLPPADTDGALAQTIRGLLTNGLGDDDDEKTVDDEVTEPAAANATAEKEDQKTGDGPEVAALRRALEEQRELVALLRGPGLEQLAQRLRGRPRGRRLLRGRQRVHGARRRGRGRTPRGRLGTDAVMSAFQSVYWM